ncbi:MAG: DUF4834 domain-containing protein [Coprobacillus sp.]|nr:DUF4834 domain-containing protein [Coprobacillus sp.]MCI9093175.1 DUF4834 domain-containing protein [Coprobacillus sp.]
MGYSYLYLFCLLILIMVVMRFFLPFFIYLFPILLIVYVVKAIFARPKRSTYEQTYQNQQTTYNQTNQSSDPNVIDVDYKVVDEEDNDTH